MTNLLIKVPLTQKTKNAILPIENVKAGRTIMDFSKKFVCECKEYSTYEKAVSAPLFRKSIKLEKTADSAQILICGLGFYDLFVNGKKITKGLLAPYISNSDDICYFDKYDLLPYLNAGENVIGVSLGDGFQNVKNGTWDFVNNITNSSPLLALTLEIKCGDSVMTYEADDFVCKKGPIWFNDQRSGVFYDATKEEKGWNDVGFKEIDWHKPIFFAKPRGKAKICEAEPVVVTREIKPYSITKGELEEYTECFDTYASSLKLFEAPPATTGGYIYDFGENNTGIFRLKIKGQRGQRIDIQCAEQLTSGKANANNIHFFPKGFVQRDLYICSGDGEEVFEPMFTYHGYRYLYVSGITEEQATKDLLTYLVVSSDLEDRGSFECSDEILNRLYEMTRRSDISNFIYFPNDCPHREKNGWTGDASISAEHMILTIGAENSWREWLHNIRAAQSEDGRLPGIVPTGGWGIEWGNGPAWDSVLFNLPYFAYKYRGETDIIKENATAMVRYLDYISKRRDERGIVEIGLGDWVPVVYEFNGKADCYTAPLGLTDSIMVLDMCRKAEEMFKIIGLDLQGELAKKLGKEMLEAIRREYVDLDTYEVKVRCQSSQALAIFFDVFADDEKQKAFDVLLDIIKEDKGVITSGFLGLRVLFHVLSDFGKSDLAFEMITHEGFPSYRYWVDKGETTLLEWFFPYDDFYTQSKNHHFLGDILNWFMTKLGGLRVENSQTVTVSPCYIEKLTWCKTSHKLPKGEIKIEWQKQNGDTMLKIETTGDVDYRVDDRHIKLSDTTYKLK